MWYYAPLEHASRRDLQAERDHAFNRTKQLESENLKLKVSSDKMCEEQLDLHSKCSDLESSLELYQEKYRRLEEIFEWSKRLRRDEDSERKALLKQVSRWNKPKAKPSR